MIQVNEVEVHAHGSEIQIMKELAHVISEITLRMSADKDVPQYMIIQDLVMGATLGKYELKEVDDGN